MKNFIATMSLTCLLAGAAAAQGMAPSQDMTPSRDTMSNSHAIAAHKTGPNTAQATTTPTETPMGETKVSKTVMHGGPVSRSDASMDCSRQANAQHLHGRACDKMRTACMAAAQKN